MISLRYRVCLRLARTFSDRTWEVLSRHAFQCEPIVARADDAASFWSSTVVLFISTVGFRSFLQPQDSAHQEDPGGQPQQEQAPSPVDPPEDRQQDPLQRQAQELAQDQARHLST